MNPGNLPIKPLRVLITNAFLSNRTGSELFARDVAFELHRRGHIPTLYAPQLGPLAEELRDSGISVVDNLRLVNEAPDIIHGQHRLEAMTAIARFAKVPALLFCHGILPWQEAPFLHPRIMYHVALSEMIREHMITNYNIPQSKIVRFSNFVDLENFRLRTLPLPARPRRALIFSNNASEANFVHPVRSACSQYGIQLDVVGIASNAPSITPETLLQDYDIVFSRGRCALESLSTGAAVICCDIEGLGSMVNTNNWSWFRRYNFGLYTLKRPITTESIMHEITKYDPANAAQVSQITREEAGLSTAVDRLLEIYLDCIFRWSKTSSDIAQETSEEITLSDFLPGLSSQIHSLNQQNASLTSELFSVNNLYQLSMSHTSGLQAELQEINSTLTWRIRRRFVEFTPFRLSYLFIKSIIENTLNFIKVHIYRNGQQKSMRWLSMHRKLTSYHKDGANPILIYQMGKVGSTSVKLSLEQAYQDLGITVPIYHRHVLNQLDEYEQAIRREWQKPERALDSIQEGRRLRDFIYSNPQLTWNLISLVRDPVARNVSAFFENLSKIIPNWYERLQAGTLDIAGLQNIFVEGKWIHFLPEEWFNSQLKPIFKIDVYSTQFPRKKGFEIYKDSQRAKLLVIRTEDLDKVANQAIHRYLGLENFKLNHYNVGDTKEYAETYREFKKLPLPVEYVKGLYSSRFAQHFYSAQELKQFSERWLLK